MKLLLTSCVAAAVAGGVVVAAAAGASGDGRPIGETPEQESVRLGCGQSPAMVIHSDLYVPSTSGDAARSPREALDRLLTAHYPRAPRALVREVASDGGQAKYHARGSGGQLLASFLISRSGGEFYVEQVTLCESTAKGWAR